MHQFLVLPAISKEISHNIEKWANEVKVSNYQLMMSTLSILISFLTIISNVHILRMKNLPYRPDTWMHYDEVIKSSKSSSTEEKVLCRTENFADYHEGFKELFRGAEMTSILEQLTGEPMVLFKEKINYEIPVPLESGQFLVFGSYLAHRSAPNKSDKGRAAIYATYNAISNGGDRREAYYEDRSGFILSGSYH
ncbi:hypothetical protein HHX47_DHR2000332 [Lentinula edodes]|nr:hypothetical protein HHX47_DHR2000332 [Lentinula edodes]